MSDTSSRPSEASRAGRRWWSYPLVWMLLAGPAIVVVAGFYTYYLAARSPDPVLSTQTPASRSTESGASLSDAPAVQARNHAATGAVPPARAASQP